MDNLKEEKYFDKKELAARLFLIHSNVDQKQIEQIVTDAFYQIGIVVGEGERNVVLDDIGSFTIEGRNGKTYRDVNTGEEKKYPDYLKLKFRGAKNYREHIENHLKAIISHLKVK